MIRNGIHKPTIEDAVEISGIETLHPGGFELTRRTAELAGLKSNINVLDVSCGRGTQAIYYAMNFGAKVTGIDISPDMVNRSKENALKAGAEDRITILQGDSQQLPFKDDYFDVVINECAVGIPDNSQLVLNEMVRVAKPGGIVVIHESTWMKPLTEPEKIELSERYGTTPLEQQEWVRMLKDSGLTNIETESEPWSRPEMFWKVRKKRDVKHYSQVLTPLERVMTFYKIMKRYGVNGLLKAKENEKIFYQAVLDGKIGYCLYRGIKT